MWDGNFSIMIQSQFVLVLCVSPMQKFNLLTKVYASNGEPCCASCITPVFNEMWSSTSLNRTHSLSSRPTSTATLTRSVTPTPPPPALPLSPSTDSGVSEGTSNNEILETTTVEETRYEVCLPFRNRHLGYTHDNCIYCMHVYMYIANMF